MIVVLLLVVVVVVVSTLPTVIILDSSFSKYLIFNFLNFTLNYCVFVFHLRYTNIPCTVAPDVLLSVAVYLVTVIGLFQRWGSFVQIV